MFTKSLTLFLLPALAVAQAYGPPIPATSASSSASSPASSTAVAPTAPSNTANQMNIDVAFNKTLTFHPSNISAPVGTLVTFYFPNFGLNHSVTQSTFANPCTPISANATTNTPAGFDSGLQSSATFTINITSTTPIWFFCKQVDHCGEGMVGAINAVGDSFTTYLNAAKAIGSSEQTITDNGPVTGGVNASATGPPVPDLTGSSAAASTTTAASSSAKVTTSFGFGLFAVVAIAVAMA